MGSADLVGEIDDITVGSHTNIDTGRPEQARLADGLRRGPL